MQTEWAEFDGDSPRVRHPISTAPKDGRVIIVGHPEVGEFPMQWGHIKQNETFAPGVVGMWMLPNGEITWAEADGDGPISWRECDQ